MAPWNFVLYITFVFLATSCSSPIDVNNVIKIPEQCRNKQYCPFKPEGYELFEQQMNDILKQFIKEDNSTRVTRSIRSVEEEISQDITSPSILSPESDWHNCPYEIKRTSIYLADFPNEDEDKRMLIVQTGKVRQMFNIVTCAKQHIPEGDQQCFRDLVFKSLFVTSTCVETFTKQNVYVYNIDKEKIEVKHIDIPVACSCQLSRKFKYQS